MGFTSDSRGKPDYNDTADPQADLQAAVDWADKVGGLLKGTSADRGALAPGAVSVGWLFAETDTGAIYSKTASGWNLVFMPDTGWTALGALQTGWSQVAGTPSPAYRVKNGILMFRGRLNATSAAGDQPFTSALPTTALPVSEHTDSLPTTSAAAFNAIVNTAGVISVLHSGSAVADVLLAFHPIPVG